MLAFLSGRSCTGLDETGAAPLGVPYVDDIEVPGNDGPGEDLASLTRDLGPEVAVREVGEDEQSDVRGPSDFRRADAGRVSRLRGALVLLCGEGRLVDEHVRLACDVQDRPRRRGVARDDDLPAGTRWPEHLLGRDTPAVGEVDRLTVLEAAVERALGNPQRHRRFDVEAAGARRLHERIAVRHDAVSNLEDDEAVVAAVHDVPRSQLNELEGVRELAEHTAEGAEELAEAGRAIHRQRKLPPAERERLQHPGQAQVVVGVEVSHEDLRKLDEADARTEELPLGPLAAVDEHAIAASADEHARETSAGSRNRAGSAEEDEVEIHGSSVRGRRLELGRAADTVARRTRS
jgi:hypothetical protein